MSQVDRFAQRYENKLGPLQSTSMDHQCYAVNSSNKYKRYFEPPKEKIAYYDVEPEHLRTRHQESPAYSLGNR